MVEARRLKVYCETSFWSFLNGRPTPLAHIAVKQAATLKWWQEIAPKCDIYVSQFVDDEVRCGESDLAERRMKSLEDAIAVDGNVREALDLAKRLLSLHAIPEREETDASHIVTAAVYGMDVLLTWNCRHMANPVTLPKTAMIIGREGYSCPVIITPQEFLDRREEFLK